MQARGIIFLSSFYLRTDWLKRRRTERKCSNPLANLGASKQGKCLFMLLTVYGHAQNCIVSTKATTMNLNFKPGFYCMASWLHFCFVFFFVCFYKLGDCVGMISIRWQEDFFFLFFAFAVVRSQVSYSHYSQNVSAMALKAFRNCTVGYITYKSQVQVYHLKLFS